MKTDQYKTSKDYERLAFLAQRTDVICFVRYSSSEASTPIFDVARTLFGNNIYHIQVRGTTYISSYGEAEFLKDCAELEVSFIEPLEEAIT